MKFTQLDDEQILGGLPFVVGGARHTLAQVIAYLGIVLSRRLYAKGRYKSIHEYCVRALKMSDGEADRRLTAARLALRFPAIIGMVKDGDLNLATVRELRDALTDENHVEILRDVSGMSAPEIQRYLVRRNPKPAVPSTIRKFPTGQFPSARLATADTTPMLEFIDEEDASPKPGMTIAVPDLGGRAATRPPVEEVANQSPPMSAGKRRRRRSRVEPLADDRFKISFTADDELVDLLHCARDLLSHGNPDGEFGPIIKHALKRLLDDMARERSAAPLEGWETTRAPSQAPQAPVSSPPSRPMRQPRRRSLRNEVPAAAAAAAAAARRDVVPRRQCSFVSEDDVRCMARSFIEVDHVQPQAFGGVAEPDPLCHAHRLQSAAEAFGRDFIARKISERGGQPSNGSRENGSHGMT